MNTQATLLISAAIVAGGIVIASAVRSGGDAVATSTHESSESSERSEPGSASQPGAGVARDPMLEGNPGDHEAARMRRELAEARAQIKRLEEQMAALADTGPAGRGEVAPDSPAFAKKRDRLLSLVASYVVGSPTKEEVEELLTLSKDRKLMALVVSELTTRIESDPDDVDARMQLAEVQASGAHSAGSITERAEMSRGVRTQISAILERDPEHWDARYMKAVGISHSQRTPQGRAMAVREFESLIAIQQKRSPESRFASTYGQLSRVYLADRDITKARDALRQGLERYPQDQSLKDQLAKLPTE